MIKLQSKRTLQFLLGASLVACFTIASCNNDEKKEEPAAGSTMDSGNTMPIKPAPKDGTTGRDSGATAPSSDTTTAHTGG